MSLEVFFPNDLRCGFRKLKEQGGGKSTIWSRPGAEIFVVIVISDVMHAAAARDPILSTQRIRKVKISMVGIYKVKVRFPSLALAHVSHFFSEREPWALKQSTHFSIFERFEILHLPDLLVSLAPSSPSKQNFDAFSSFVRLFRSF